MALAIRAVIALNADLLTLDAEYNKLAECMAQGERDDFDQGWLTRKSSSIEIEE